MNDDGDELDLTLRDKVWIWFTLAVTGIIWCLAIAAAAQAVWSYAHAQP